MRLPRLAAWCAVAAAFSACAKAPATPEPVPIDRARCARCGMLVSTEQGSGQAVFPGRDPLFYDDIGCLAGDRDAWERDGGRPFVAVEGAGWLPAERAFYARPRGLRTAMGYGYSAWPDAAQAAARDGEGRARDWAEVLRESARPAPGGGAP